jgi:hypothetical protein
MVNKKLVVARRAAPSTAKTDLVTRVTGEAISERAYVLFQAHGSRHGHDVEDWIAAEAELQKGETAENRQARRLR